MSPTNLFQTRTNAQTPMAAVTRCVRTTQEVTDAPASMGLCYSLTGNHAKVRRSDDSFLCSKYSETEVNRQM